MTHPLDEGTKLDAIEEGVWQGRPSEPYKNMVGPFGGFVSAVFMRSVLEDPRVMGTPVALTVNFCGGLGDAPFTIATKLQRGGKYTQHWSLELSQEEGGVRATASIVMGTRGDAFSHQIAKAPQTRDWQTIEPLPALSMFNWINSYEFRFASGAPSFAGKEFDPLKEEPTEVWVRDKPSRPLDYLSLTALADTFFLRLLHVRGTFPPMGTVTLTTYFHATPDELQAQGDHPLLAVANCNRLHGQFNDQPICLFGVNGNALVSGTQVAWYKH